MSEKEYEWNQQLHRRPDGQLYLIQQLIRKKTGRPIIRRIIELTSSRQLTELLRRVHYE